MPGSEETNKGPAAVFFNNKLYVFYIGDDTKKIFYRSSADGLNWSAEKTIGDLYMAEETPAPIVFNGHLYLYYIDAYRSADNVYVTYMTSGENWYERQAIKLNNYCGGISATVFNNNVVLGWTGASGHIYLLTSPNGLGFTGSFIPTGEHTNWAPSLTTYGGKLYMAFSGITTKKLYLTSTSNLSSFSTNVISVGSATAYTDDQPSIIDDGYKLVAAVKGNGNRLLYQMYSYDGSTWSGLTTIPGESIAGPYLVKTTW